MNDHLRNKRLKKTRRVKIEKHLAELLLHALPSAVPIAHLRLLQLLPNCVALEVSEHHIFGSVVKSVMESVVESVMKSVVQSVVQSVVHSLENVVHSVESVEGVVQSVESVKSCAECTFKIL